MIKINILLVTLLSLCACGSYTTEDQRKNIYNIEHDARRIVPQPNTALLYVFPDGISFGSLSTQLRINGEEAFDVGEFTKDFFVFCLPPQKYTIEFVAFLPFPNKTEFLDAKAGGVYIRQFRQGMHREPGGPLTGSTLKEVGVEVAREKLKSKRLSEEPTYANSKYRCSSFM